MFDIEHTDQFTEWWDTLSDQEQEELAARIDLLAMHGPGMRRPYSGEIKGSAFDPQMKELICNVGRAHLRVLYMFDPRRIAILLLGGDKAGVWDSWYNSFIPLADELYREYLKELHEEGLL